MPSLKKTAIQKGRKDSVNGKTVVFVPLTRASTSGWSFQKPKPFVRTDSLNL